MKTTVQTPRKPLVLTSKRVYGFNQTTTSQGAPTGHTVTTLTL